MKIASVKRDLYLRCLDIIRGLPSDEVLTGTELADKLGVLKGSGQTKLAFAKLIHNRAKVRMSGGDVWVYGTFAGLKNLRKQQQGEEIEDSKN